MTNEAAEIITKFGGELYEDYSGRGMYGKTTSAVVFDTESEYINTLAEIMDNEEQENRTIVAEFMRNQNIDSMGKGIIVY